MPITNAYIYDRCKDHDLEIFLKSRRPSLIYDTLSAIPSLVIAYGYTKCRVMPITMGILYIRGVWL